MRNYCPNCAAPIERRMPDGDDRPRDLCSVCDNVFYDNPINVVGTIVERAGAVLLCRRAIEPRRGFWTMPAGFLELGESSFGGAVRETREEALAEVENGQLFSMIDVTHISQIHIFYRAQLTADQWGAGPESEVVGFFNEHEIDWSQLAFPSIHRTLTHYFADRARGHFEPHLEVLERDSWQTLGLDRDPRPLA